jgi:hypothetical protein
VVNGSARVPARLQPPIGFVLKNERMDGVSGSKLSQLQGVVVFLLYSEAWESSNPEHVTIQRYTLRLHVPQKLTSYDATAAYAWSNVSYYSCSGNDKKL